MNSQNERPLLIQCGADRLLAIVHTPVERAAAFGVVIVVGGPQYRVGSHRQFLLIARDFASHGYPVLRFDYRGMGDSDGEYRGFEHIEQDLRAAIDAFLAAEPGIRSVVLWGLCDGGSAALMYAPSDARVSAVSLVNGWARSQAGEAKAYVRHYYGARFLQSSFWRKLFSGRMNIMHSVRDYARALRASRNAPDATGSGAAFLGRMRSAYRAFTKPLLFLESGRDLTAAEFATLRADDRGWDVAGRKNLAFVRLADADHTFSDRTMLAAASRHCLEWLATIDGRAAGASAAPRAER
jgi:exosortase A-associated hydrolase 1